MADTSGRISLWGVEVFLATAEEKSVSAAARRLGASPSAISQQISGLEAALGAELMNRRERPLTLTAAGEILRRRGQIIVNEAAQIRAELGANDLSSLTRMRLGMIEDFDADVSPRLLQELSQSFGRTVFLLETGPSHRLLDALDTRALDVVVAADMGASADWMEVHSLLREPFVAAAPRGVIDPAAALESLSRLPLIQYTPRHHMGRVIADHLARQNLTMAHRFELDSYHAITAMVASGRGWTILTPLGVGYAKRFIDDIDVLPLPFAPLERTISLSARRDVLGDMPSQTAQRLRALLQEHVVDPMVARHPWLEGELRVL